MSCCEKKWGVDTISRDQEKNMAANVIYAGIDRITTPRPNNICSSDGYGKAVWDIGTKRFVIHLDRCSPEDLQSGQVRVCVKTKEGDTYKDEKWEWIIVTFPAKQIVKPANNDNDSEEGVPATSSR